MWRGWDGGWGEQGTGRTGSITAEYPDPSEGRLVHSQAGKKAHGETTPWLRAAWAKYNRHHPPLIINNPSCILRDDRSSIELGTGRFSKRKRGRGGLCYQLHLRFHLLHPATQFPAPVYSPSWATAKHYRRSARYIFRVRSGLREHHAEVAHVTDPSLADPWTRERERSIR